MITIGSTLWNGLLVVVSLGVGVTFAAHAFVTDRTICLAHALMGLAMAGMFWPTGDPTPATAGIVIFVLLGAWFAAGWLRSGARRIDESAHVVVGSVAMVLMYLTHGGGTHVGHGEHAGHALHGGGNAATNGGPGALLAAAGLLFTGYFLWHTWELMARRAQPVPPPTAATDAVLLLRHRAAPRVETAAHVGTGLLMVVTFLGTI